MESHEGDLRSVVKDENQVRATQENYQKAGLEPKEVALLDYAVKLTKAPQSVEQADLESLRQHGYSEEQFVDAVHCTAYFNFINRVLEGLGVDPEKFMRYSNR